MKWRQQAIAKCPAFGRGGAQRVPRGVHQQRLRGRADVPRAGSGGHPQRASLTSEGRAGMPSRHGPLLLQDNEPRSPEVRQPWLPRLSVASETRGGRRACRLLWAVRANRWSDSLPINQLRPSGGLPTGQEQQRLLVSPHLRGSHRHPPSPQPCRAQLAP